MRRVAGALTHLLIGALIVLLFLYPLIVGGTLGKRYPQATVLVTVFVLVAIAFFALRRAWRILGLVGIAVVQSPR